MASPGLSEIVTSTLRNRTKKIADNVTRNNALLVRLNRKGNVRPFNGGRTIVENIEYNNNSTYQRYSGYQVLNIQPTDVFTAAEFAIRQVAIAISISGLEQLQNNGEWAVFDLLRGRIKNAEKTMQNGMSYDIYSDGTQTGQIGGLQLLVASSPSSGTVGGIDRGTWNFWRNQTYSAATDGGAALSSANVYSYMLALYLKMVRGSDRPDLWVASNAAWQAYNESLHAIQRIAADSSTDVGGAGFRSLKFMDSDVVLDGGWQGVTNDGSNFGSGGAFALGGIPSGVHFYALNTDYLFLRPHSERNMVEIAPGERFSVNQDAMVKLLGWAGNMTMSNAFLQGVLTT